MKEVLSKLLHDQGTIPSFVPGGMEVWRYDSVFMTREHWIGAPGSMEKREYNRLGAMDRRVPSEWDRQCHQTDGRTRSQCVSSGEENLHWFLQEQMPNGFELVFARETKTEAMSHCSTGLLDLFKVAMSLEAVASQNV